MSSSGQVGGVENVPTDGLVPQSALLPVPTLNNLRVSAAPSLLFIDSRVDHYQSLIAGVAAGTQVYVLTPEHDAIAQITQALQNQSGIGSIHIVSHGVDGGLQVGRDWLTGRNLDSYAPQLQQWSQALTHDADILLYGCNVAATEQGKSFVAALSQLTGADVAASENLTGSATHNGDWVLEFATGAIAADSPLALSATEAYRHTLSVVINEWSHGNGGLREWVELLVTETTDLRGWTFIDGNAASPYFTFANVNEWASVAAGTLIVIYNDGDRDTILPADDTNFADDNFTIITPHSNATLFTVGVGWQGFANATATDNPVLSNSASAIVHDWDQTNSGAFTGLLRPVANQAVYYTGNSAAGVATAVNWTQSAANSSTVTPGLGNGGDNTTWIDSLRSPSPTLPEVTITSSTAAIAEGTTDSFVISRGADTSGDLTINLTIDGSSTASTTDYTLSGGSVSISGNSLTVTIPNGQTSVSVSMGAIAEALSFAEATETLQLNLTTDSSYTIGTNANAAISITQNGFVVINTNDSGTGSLRQAILNANAIAGADTITFAGATFTDATTDIITLTSGQLQINSTLYINGTGANRLIISGNNASRIFDVTIGNRAYFNDFTVANGRSLFGSGINNAGNLTLNNVTIRNNRASLFGGGVSNYGILAVNNSIIRNNISEQDGGGLQNESIVSIMTVTDSTIAGNTSIVGGGISVFSGTLTLNRSTVSGNTAKSGGGISNAATTNITNSTISGNSAENGGGVYNRENTSSVVPKTTLTNVTVANNTATTGVGGGISIVEGTVTLRNTIVATNLNTAAPDLAGAFINGGNNLVGRSNGSTGVVNGVNGSIVGTIAAPVNPNLAPLANNGGSTQTHALLPTSQAINAGNNTGVSAVVDQRGVTRILYGTIDIGAYEATLPQVQIVATDAIATEIPGNRGTFRITRDTTVGSLTVNLTLAGTASLSDYRFSNNVTVSGNRISVTIPNGQTFVDININPILDAVSEGNESVVLRLANGQYAVGATQNTATVNILDAPVVSLGVPDGIVNEHIPNSGKFRIRRAGNLSQPLSVKYLIGGTATNGIDYTPLSGVATIAAGQSFVDVVINPINDTLSELGETIRITLVPGSYALNPIAKAANLTIAANDPIISFTPIQNSVAEGNSGTRLVSYRVSLSHASDQAVTVNYATVDGTATVGNGDYRRVAPTRLTFTPGMTQQTVTVAVNGDVRYEGNETFFVQLANPVNGAINPSAWRRVAQVVNDDAMTAYNFGASSFRVPEGNQQNTVLIPVVRTGNVAFASAVQVRLTGGTAIAGVDYVGQLVTVGFAAGQTTAWVPLTLLGNTTNNLERSLSLSIIGFSHLGAYTDVPVAVVTVVDDDVLFQRGTGYSGAN
ncbi:DUF4347 domain-containing protein [Leptolyngbya sp. AN02str]|uniref:DUF4347 domain-containing protein n=1 Tax=Leptolyngbya sp. AN02str TaxID=3423363 RepID=UPI003D3199A2